MGDLWNEAPLGQVYVCGACGKTSRNRAGFVNDGTPRGGPSVASPGWDESCMLNAVLCFERVGDAPYEAVPEGWSALASAKES